jgi:hypothetical protein
VTARVPELGDWSCPGQADLLEELPVRPKRIQRRRTKGWRMPDGALYVGRPSRWGNPFVVGEFAPHRHRAAGHPFELYIDRHRIARVDQAVALYSRIITEPTEHQYVGHVAPTVDEVRRELAGRDLACWCPLELPCHADVLLRLANGWPDLDDEGSDG